MHLSSQTNRPAVWTRTACIGGGYIVAVWLVYLKLVASGFAWGGLYLPLALLVVQCAAIALMVAGSFFTKRVNQVRDRVTRRVAPELREKLALYAAGEGNSASFQLLNRTYARDVERSMDEFLSSLTGEPHARVSGLAADIGLVARWQRQYRNGRIGKRRRAVARLSLLSGSAGYTTLLSALKDKDASVRIDAARGLLRSGGRPEIERVFDFAVAGSFLIRVILAEALRPHALILCERAIPRGLGSDDPDTILIALQFVQAWQSSMPLPNLIPLLKHGDPRIRAQSLRMLPHNFSSTHAESDILTALKDADPDVRAAAAFAAAKLEMDSALPVLTGGLRDSNSGAAKACATALGELGPPGLKALTDEIFYGTHPAAAMEALELVGMNR